MYNWKIIGHKKQLEQIESDIASNNLAHAYLFAGPSSVGKFAIAKMMVNILQCPNNLCHQCSACIQVQKGGHPDTIIITGEENESIKIENIRSIIERLNRTKQGLYKVLLVDKAERLTPEAANCLLKTLEEPPPDTIIILTTDNIRTLLPTIISRTRLVKFNAYSIKFLEEKLKEEFPEAEEETLKQVCSLALGKSGKAIKLLKNTDLLSSYRKMYNVTCELLENEPVYKKFLVIEEVIGADINISEFLDVFTHLVRNRLYQGVKENVSDENIHRQKHLLGLLASIEETRNLLKRNVNARLLLENLALKATL